MNDALTHAAMECNSLLESATTTSTSGITANTVIKTAVRLLWFIAWYYEWIGKLAEWIGKISKYHVNATVRAVAFKWI